jgi:hypothetical protein
MDHFDTPLGFRLLNEAPKVLLPLLYILTILSHSHQWSNLGYIKDHPGDNHFGCLRPCMLGYGLFNGVKDGTCFLNLTNFEI